MAFAHGTGFAPELLYPGLANIWGEEYAELPTAYTEYYRMENSNQAFEKEQGMTSFGYAGVKDQGDSVPYARAYQGFQKEYRHITYGIGAIITREMQEDDQYNYINKIPMMLARSLRETEEIVAAAPINLGFTSSSAVNPYLGADGQPLYSASHPRVDGGTAQTNTATADLTQTSLENALIDIMNWKDDQGKLINLDVTTLVVPPANRFNAQKILETQYKVDSADNTVNVISNMNIKLVVNRYITDIDSWYLMTNCIDGLKFFNRRSAEIQRDNDFDTENLKIKTTRRFSVGHSDYRGTYGSPGA